MKTITQQLENKVTTQMQDKHFELYIKQARYKGNGIYFIPQTNLYSTDTRELFLMFVAARENIKYVTV